MSDTTGETSTKAQGTSLCAGENQFCTVNLLCSQYEMCHEREQGVSQVGPIHAELLCRMLNKHQTRSAYLQGHYRRGWLKTCLPTRGMRQLHC